MLLRASSGPILARTYADAAANYNKDKVLHWHLQMVEITLLPDYKRVGKPYRFDPPCARSAHIDDDWWQAVLPDFISIVTKVQTLQYRMLPIPTQHSTGHWHNLPIVVWAKPVTSPFDRGHR